MNYEKSLSRNSKEIGAKKEQYSPQAIEVYSRAQRPRIHEQILQFDPRWQGPIQVKIHREKEQDWEYFFRRMCLSEAEIVLEKGRLASTVKKGGYGTASSPSTGILTDLQYATAGINNYRGADSMYPYLVVFEALPGTISHIQSLTSESRSGIMLVKFHGRSPGYRIEVNSQAFHTVNEQIGRVYCYKQQTNGNRR